MKKHNNYTQSIHPHQKNMCLNEKKLANKQKHYAQIKIQMEISQERALESIAMRAFVAITLDNRIP